VEKGSSAIAPAGDAIIIVRRSVEAPRELVWRMWTEPQHIAKWWGPNGFTNTVHSMDVRPGGRWVYVMHGPDGTDYDNLILYREVVRPERLVYEHSGSEAVDDPHRFHVVVTFKEKDGATEVVMHSTFPSVEARDHVIREFGALEGGKQTLDRFAAYAESR
jgi:uncharacterized protein YndB with AHSA1/START domain